VLESKRLELQRLLKRLELMPSHDSLVGIIAVRCVDCWRRHSWCCPTFWEQLRAWVVLTPEPQTYDTVLRETLSNMLRIDLGDVVWTAGVSFHWPPSACLAADAHWDHYISVNYSVARCRRQCAFLPGPSWQPAHLPRLPFHLYLPHLRSTSLGQPLLWGSGRSTNCMMRRLMTLKAPGC